MSKRVETESIRQSIIAKFFQLKVRAMGGGLRIIELPPYITVEERDLIVQAVNEYKG